MAVLAGVALVLVATAMIGNRDDRDETVPAGAWAQSVCGAIGTWRGEMELIVDDVRQAQATGTESVEEPQSETPQGSAGSVRAGLERSVGATEVLVTGIDYAGVPDTEQGEAAAQQVTSWAASSLAALEDAQSALDAEAATPEEAVAQLAGAAGALRLVLVSGAETLADVALLDPELTAAVQESSTCQELRGTPSQT